MRQSTAALALIELSGSPPRWLVQWNDGWDTYSLVGGHQHAGESFRECLCREVTEELRLAEGTEFRVGFYPLTCAAYRAFSRRAQKETEYRLELFAVELLGEAVARVSADAANRWVTRREIAAQRADDGRPISDQVRRLFDAADDADFDLFVSYARADNTAGQVTRLVEHIRDEHDRFAPLDPLGIFFDVWGIRDGHDWERRIYKGLSQSKVMLAILSPNYFKSEWCRREWQTFVDLEMSRTYPGEAIHSIYIAPHPDFEPAAAAPGDSWLRDLQQRQFVNAKPWWPAGAEALQRADVQRRLTYLREAVCDRVAKVRQIDRTPRNLRERNPNFVGRDDELRQLRHLLTLRQTAAITAIHGIGGIGKSALAREYAHRFRLEYPGGQFEIDLSRIRSADELRLALIDVANNYLDARILPEKMQGHLDQAFGEAKVLFEARPQVLLILDNVDDGRLVSKANRARCLPSPERVHVIVTSRLEPVLLGSIEPLPLDALSTADAINLLRRYRPFENDARDGGCDDYRTGDRSPEETAADGRPELWCSRPGCPAGETPAPQLGTSPASGSDTEWKAALRIVNRLGCHALAVEVVAVYLGEHREILLSDYLRGLINKGIGVKLAQAGEDQGVRARVEHPETLIAPLLEPTLASLSPLERRALEWAALLPPDNIPLAWLRDLLCQDLCDSPPPASYLPSPLGGEGPGVRGPATTDADRPSRNIPSPLTPLPQGERGTERASLLDHDPDDPDPWVTTLARLDGLRLLVTVTAGQLGRMHRIVQALVCDRRDAELLARHLEYLEGHAEVRGEFVNRNWGRPGVNWELDPLFDFARQRLDAASGRVGYLVDRLIEPLKLAGRLITAVGLQERVIAFESRRLEQAPENADYARRLSVSNERMGNLFSALGDGVRARECFEKALAVSERLAEQAPENADYAHDLSISYNNIGDLFRALGDGVRAREFYEKAMAVSERLKEQAPENAGYARDLSVIYDRMGDLFRALGDGVRAREFCEKSLAVRERLAEQAPENADSARHLSSGYGRMGDLFDALGDGVRAREFYEKSLAVIERLAEQAPENAVYARDLSVNFIKMGDLFLALRDGVRAREFYEKSLAVRERLAKEAPENADYARDLSWSNGKMGDLFVALGDDVRAREFYEKSLAVIKRLAEQAPDNAAWQRDLWVSYLTTGNILEKTCSPAEALPFWRRAVQTLSQLKQKGTFIWPGEERIHQHLEQMIGDMTGPEEAGE